MNDTDSRFFIAVVKLNCECCFWTIFVISLSSFRFSFKCSVLAFWVSFGILIFGNLSTADAEKITILKVFLTVKV